VERRGFLRSIAIGSGACLAGCAPEPPPDPDPLACLRDGPHPSTALEFPASPYFDGLAGDLDARGHGNPVVLIDLDRLDANVDEIAASIAPLRYRIVEKSLPSIDLLRHVSLRSGSESFLVLHLPFLPALLSAFPLADVVVGKTHLTRAIAQFFASLDPSAHADAASRVVFLSDSAAGVGELRALATALGLTLRVAVDIDVGLRRSGVPSPDHLPPVLDALSADGSIELAGFLGYDGHVAHVPTGAAGIDAAFTDAMAAYQTFVDVLADYPTLAANPNLIFQSGGSTTYPLYATSETPVNDVAAGGGALRPGDYPDHVISALVPAIFVASSVLARYETPLLPFFDEAASARILGGRKGVTLHGGGWPSRWSHPPDVRQAALVSDPTGISLVPNQGLCTAPADTPLRVGDWVFQHPRQSDVLFQFETIHLVRGGRLLEETMAAYPRRL
jgi:D-serine deaminase-like pyridoxal phosphate-dependent protein